MKLVLNSSTYLYLLQDQMDKPIKIVFLGTPEFSCLFLIELSKDKRFQVCAVISQENKKIGRKQILTPPPIKILADQLNLPVFQTAKLNKDLELIEKIRSYHPDFLVVIAFGQILSSSILAIPAIKAINVHGSILPKYRGASPIEQALLNGDQETGLSVMEMAKTMDTGAVYEVYREKIEANDNNQSLRDKLSKSGATRLPQTLIEIFQQNLHSTPQDESQATYCSKISKEDGLIEGKSMPAQQIINKYRAYSTWPGIYLKTHDKFLKLHQIQNTNLQISSGQFSYDNQYIYLGTTTTAIQINSLQLEGKTIQDSKTFLQGNKNILG